MGRGDPRLKKTLHQQAYERLLSMQAFGESKAECKKQGELKDKIFSYSTYKTYKKRIKVFLQYMTKTHPEVTTLKKAKKLIPEYLKDRCTQGLSAWTVQTDAKALSKLFDISIADADYFIPPERHREDIKRSRTPAKRDKNFSVEKNLSLIQFCKSTGLRRSELEKLRPEDLCSAAEVPQELLVCENIAVSYLKVIGKGGKLRFVPIVGPYAQQTVTRITETPPGAKVWKAVHSCCDVHSYRADYAMYIYKAYERDVNTLKAPDRYCCRKDSSGIVLDRSAMLIASRALGHNRIDVIAGHYLRCL